MISLREELLKKILSQPTAPYRERHMISAITTELDMAGVPHFSDPIGNIILGVGSRAEYMRLIRQKSKEPLRVFIAHMDHPGFHGLEWKSPTQLAVKWHGGSPIRFIEGADVWLATSSGWVQPRAAGKVVASQLIASGRAIESMVIQTDAEISSKFKADKLYGGFVFREHLWQEGELLYTKAADDLVGSFAITSVALDLFDLGKALKKKSGRPPFLGLLTRAEEVGYIGAIGHFELGWLKQAKRPIVCVSLETSRTFPGAEIGKGPVVRLGDRTTVFNANALRVFLDLAKRILPDRHQRRIMDGGSCEGTAATAYGFPCVGISVPLGNYHNQSLEGGPDSRGPDGPAPEFVHRQDVQGLLELCHGLLESNLAWADPWKDKIKEFKADYKKARDLLRSGP